MDVGLTKDPNNPAAAPVAMSLRKKGIRAPLHAELSIASSAATVKPMMAPPATDAPVPSRDTPPFVPGGTTFSVVMRIGGVLERIPSSEARVSPRQHAKCLNINSI